MRLRLLSGHAAYWNWTDGALLARGAVCEAELPRLEQELSRISAQHFASRPSRTAELKFILTAILCLAGVVLSPPIGPILILLTLAGIALLVWDGAEVFNIWLRQIRHTMQLRDLARQLATLREEADTIRLVIEARSTNISR